MTDGSDDELLSDWRIWWRADKYSVWGVCLVTLALLTYTVLRAWCISFYCDEAGSFLDFTGLPAWKILLFRGTNANNHVLNTLAMKLVRVLGTDKEFWLRLPNVLCHVLYIWASFLWVRRYGPRKLFLPAFIVVNVNPFLVEHFAVARGYGMAMAFAMCALYTLCRFGETMERRYVRWTMWLGFLCVLSNLTLLLFFAGLMACVCMLEGRHVLLSTRSADRVPVRLVLCDLMAAILPTLLVCALVVAALTGLTGSRDAWVGGEVGFLRDTVWSLILYSFHYVRYGPLTGILLRGVFGLVVLSVCVEGVAVAIRLVRRHYSILGDPCALLLVVIGAVSLGSVAQHYIMGTKYLIGRTALILLPLFLLLIVRQLGCLIDGTGSAWGRRAAGLTLVLTGVIFPIHFARAANLTHVLEAQFDAKTRTALCDLDAVLAEDGASPGAATLGIDQLFLPTVRYYRYRGHITGVGEVIFKDPQDCDYYYLLEEHAHDVLSSGEMEILSRYPLSKSVLCRRIAE